jgi:hypothetical protein
MNHLHISRKVVLVVTLTGLAFVAGWASASNMGFKLNFGTLNAVNRLLYGSGVSLDAEQDMLVVKLDLANQDLSPRNSNMGFKLNIQSFPAPDVPIPVEVEGDAYMLGWFVPIGGGEPYLGLQPQSPPVGDD